MAISYRNLFANKVEKTDIIKATQAWVCPNDVTSVELIMCGGGRGTTGGSATLSGSGSAGSVFYEVLTVVPGTTYTITIGAGGVGGTANGGVPSAGVASSFGNLFTAAGATTTSAGGLGGGGGSGSVYITTPTTGTPYVSGYALLQGQPGAFGYGGGGGGAASSVFNGTYTSIALGWGTNGGGRANVNGQANTGGGAGASSLSSGNGFSGGSGIAVIKYWSAL